MLEEGVESLEDLENISIEGWPPDSWLKPTFSEGDIVDAVVLSVASEEASVKVKDYLGKMNNSDIDWTQTKNLEGLIEEGDLILIKIKLCYKI